LKLMSYLMTESAVAEVQRGTTGSNRLTILAAEILAEHEGIVRSLKRGLDHAIAAGELLIEAKALLKHGQWLPWLADHCAISERTARLYMRLAKNKVRLEGQIGNVADFSVRGAVALIAGPKQLGLPEFVQLAVDSGIDDSEISALHNEQVQRDRRRVAAATVTMALEEIIKISKERSDSRAAVSAWDEFGDQLMSAIADYRRSLESDVSLDATSAVLRAENLAGQMLMHVEAGHA